MADNSPATQLLHNLRSQLNNISMNAELGKMELEALTSPQHPDATTAEPLACIDSIRSACAACAGIVDELALLWGAGSETPQVNNPDRR